MYCCAMGRPHRSIEVIGDSRRADSGGGARAQRRDVNPSSLWRRDEASNDLRALPVSPALPGTPGPHSAYSSQRGRPGRITRRSALMHKDEIKGAAKDAKASVKEGLDRKSTRLNSSHRCIS